MNHWTISITDRSLQRITLAWLVCSYLKNYLVSAQGWVPTNMKVVGQVKKKDLLNRITASQHRISCGGRPKQNNLQDASQHRITHGGRPK